MQPEVVESAARFVVNEYEKFKNYTIAAWYAFSNDGKYQNGQGACACHAILRYYKPNYYDQMITSYPSADEEFFNFLKNVLYQEYSDIFHLETEPERGEAYIRISDLSKIPANVLLNFCQASRIPLEFPIQTASWRSFVEQGYHPSFALILSGVNFSNGKVNEFYFSPGHWPFDNTCSVKALVSGKPVSDKADFKSNPAGTTPTNCIWGNTDNLRLMVGKSIDEIVLEWKEKHEILLTS